MNLNPFSKKRKKASPFVVLKRVGEAVNWNGVDSHNWANVTSSDTYHKLRLSLDDFILEMVLKGYSRDHIKGALMIINRIESMVPPDTQKDEDGGETSMSTLYLDFSPGDPVVTGT